PGRPRPLPWLPNAGPIVYAINNLPYCHGRGELPLRTRDLSERIDCERDESNAPTRLACDLASLLRRCRQRRALTFIPGVQAEEVDLSALVSRDDVPTVRRAGDLSE